MTRKHTYQLPIHVIIEMIQDLHEQVALRASVPAVPGILSQKGFATIIVSDKGVQWCVIAEQSTGSILSQQDEALNILQRYDKLEWRLLSPEELSSHKNLSHPDMHSSETNIERIPARELSLTSAQMQTLPHAQKQVFALVNGRNTVEHIAHLLTKSPHEVSTILLKLKKQQLITL